MEYALFHCFAAKYLKEFNPYFVVFTFGSDSVLLPLKSYLLFLILTSSLKELVHDNAHVWVLTVADCFSTNRKRIRCMQVNLKKFKLIVRDARVFPGIWFDFIYPHNSSLFFATPQIYVTADKNKINSPVLLWNKHLPTCIFTRLYPH